ncbi:MAG TPA: Stp1/IreP family PP2C-type Ser/Thr phosphatase [Polyangiaceae bacterium]|nr:Stp1/IreP family PP2C-type Ser/Thr phosphatase [Polyangiaceae bacterium]
MGIKLAVAAKTDVGKVRTNNEDAFVVADLNRGDPVNVESSPGDFDVVERGVLMAVSDGMGGEQAGEVASALVVETLRKAMAEDAPESEESNSAITKAIEAAVIKANEEVFAAAKDPGKRGMGATLTAVYIQRDTAYIAEIGDSRAYLIRGRRVRQMTKDQSFVQLLLDSGAISEEEAKNYPHKNIILQAIGQQKVLNTAVGKLELRRGDRLILCSDGLSNKVAPEEMREVVCDATSLSNACAKLVALANERGGDDNATVVLAQLTGDDLRPYRDEESVTQTFEVVKLGPNADVGGPPLPADEDAPAQPQTASAAAGTPAPSPEDEADLRSRPLQMAVAVVMMLVMLGVFYLLFKD